MKELTIITHLGLGDLILQSGLAVHLAKEYDKVYFPCRKRDYNSVRSFFLLQPKIEVVPVNTESTTPEHVGIKAGSDALFLGFYGRFNARAPMDHEISFTENFYRQAGVSYDVRWDECPIQEVVRDFYYMEPPRPFNFSHDDPVLGFTIKIHPRLWDVYALDRGASILSYAAYMRAADRIDVIDGPFLHLAESIETSGELVYHKYARPLSARWNDIDCPTRKKWTVLT